MDTRERLRREMEETRQKYHHLLTQVPQEALSLPSRNPSWTIGEILYHMTLAPKFIFADVRMIAGGSRIYRLIPYIVPRPLFNWANTRFTRFGARRLSHDSLAREYDKGHAIALRALDKVDENEFSKSATYPDWDPMLSGDVTVERLFHYLKDHFENHVADIEGALGEQK